MRSDERLASRLVGAEPDRLLGHRHAISSVASTFECRSSPASSRDRQFGGSPATPELGPSGSGLRAARRRAGKQLILKWFGSTACADRSASCLSGRVRGTPTPVRARSTKSVRREATEEELVAMERLLRDGLEAGGLGFSSSWSRTHNDADGHMVPSRYSTAHEIVELCRVVKDHRGTSLEFIRMVGPVHSPGPSSSWRTCPWRPLGRSTGTS